MADRGVPDAGKRHRRVVKPKPLTCRRHQDTDGHHNVHQEYSSNAIAVPRDTQTPLAASSKTPGLGAVFFCPPAEIHCAAADLSRDMGIHLESLQWFPQHGHLMGHNHTTKLTLVQLFKDWWCLRTF